MPDAAAKIAPAFPPSALAPTPSAAPAILNGDAWLPALRVAGAVQVGGFILDLALGGRGFPSLFWPASGLAAAVFAAACLGTHFALHRGAPALLATLGGARLAVVCLGVLVAWGALLGTFPQVAAGPAALPQRVLSAPPFIAALLLLLANLAWALLTHLSRGLRWSSLFLLNHLGVLIAVGAGLFGAGDVRRLDLWIAEGDFGWTAVSSVPGSNQSPVELPFAVHLHSLEVRHYPPQLTLLRAKDGETVLPRGVAPLTLSPGLRATLVGYEVEVLEFTEAAPWSPQARDPLPAARLRVRAPGGQVSEGWVTAGHGRVPPLYLGLGDAVAGLTAPRPREFRSTFTLVVPDASAGRRVSVRVNEPLRHGAWWLYQKGYDTERADARRWSQIEAVRDPWLPAVYAGFALMAAGALLAFGRAATLARNVALPSAAGGHSDRAASTVP